MTSHGMAWYGMATRPDPPSNPTLRLLSYPLLSSPLIAHTTHHAPRITHRIPHTIRVVTEAAPLPGYKGYDCGRRNCPAGDVTSERYGRGGKTEMQRVICPFESDASQPDFFTLSLYGQVRQTTTTTIKTTTPNPTPPPRRAHRSEKLTPRSKSVPPWKR